VGRRGHALQFALQKRDPGAPPGHHHVELPSGGARGVGSARVRTHSRARVHTHTHTHTHKLSLSRSLALRTRAAARSIVRAAACHNTCSARWRAQRTHSHTACAQARWRVFVGRLAISHTPGRRRRARHTRRDPNSACRGGLLAPIAAPTLPSTRAARVARPSHVCVYALN